MVKTNETNNISADKEKDVNGYVNKYINIVNDKISFVNDVSELIDELLGALMKILLMISHYKN